MKDMQEQQRVGMRFFENLTRDVTHFQKEKFGDLIQSVAEVIASIDVNGASDAGVFFKTLQGDESFLGLYCHSLANLFEILNLFSQNDWYGDALMKLHEVNFDDETYVVENDQLFRRQRQAVHLLG